MNILLVEPDKVLGFAAMETLKTGGHHKVVWRRTAQGALDALDQKLPDVIVLEIQLGIHNGIEFIYEMRSYPEWQHIPIIVHTINANTLDGRFDETFAQLGVRTVLYKPRTSPRQLVSAVSRLLPV